MDTAAPAPASPRAYEPQGATEEQADPYGRPLYGPVARVPPGGDPINLRPAPQEAPPILPTGRSRTALLIGIGAAVLVVLGLVAVAGIFAYRGDDDQELTAGAVPTQTRAAELARVAQLETTVAGMPATPSPPPTAPTNAPVEASILDTPSPDPPTATSEPTTAPTEAPDPTEADGQAADDDGAVGEGDLPAQAGPADLLPTDATAPEGFTLSDESAASSIDDVSLSFTDPAATAGFLEAWGWQGNATRTYQLAADAVAPDSGLTFLYVSVHQFASPGAAAEALTYFSDELAQGGFVDADVTAVGESTRGLIQTTEEGIENGALYVQQGSFLLRVGTSGAAGQSLAAAAEAVEAILAGVTAATGPLAG
ncbi:MAG: hypothetical protein WKF80_06890 [Thermomicrobiales bacterium]